MMLTRRCCRWGRSPDELHTHAYSCRIHEAEKPAGEANASYLQHPTSRIGAHTNAHHPDMNDNISNTACGSPSGCSLLLYNQCSMRIPPASSESPTAYRVGQYTHIALPVRYSTIRANAATTSTDDTMGVNSIPSALKRSWWSTHAAPTCSCSQPHLQSHHRARATTSRHQIASTLIS
jgi:hypothetical protein